MFTKIHFPIINTSNINFDTDYNLSNDEYNRMFVQHFQENEASMQSFVNNNFNNKNNFSTYSNNEIMRDVNDFISYSDEIEAIVSSYHNSNNRDDVEIIKDIIGEGKISMFSVNINPNCLDYDLACEVKSWIGESVKINNDKMLDNKTKLSYLPSRDLRVDLNEKESVTFNKCKVLKDESDKNSPMKIIIIVDNIKNN
jgi:hypothetical protein